VPGDWRRPHNEELHNLYSSPYIIRMVKPRRRWSGRVACMGCDRKAYNILVGNPERKRPLGRPRHNWKIILGWVFLNCMGICGLDSCGSR